MEAWDLMRGKSICLSLLYGVTCLALGAWTLKSSANAVGTYSVDEAADSSDYGDMTYSGDEDMAGAGMTDVAGNAVKIRTGVSVASVNLSGMIESEAKTALEDYMKELNAANLNLTCQNDVVTIPLEEIQMNADIDAVIQHALHIGERGNIVKRYKEAEDAARTGINLDLPVYCDASHVQQALENHLDELNTTPVEVSMVRKGGEFIISESHDGRTLRMDETVQAVVDALNTHDWTQTEAVAEMCVDVTPATHTTAELEVVKDLLGSYSTSYYGSSNNRIANIETGAAKIDNYVLWPGECFSFLSMTVPFTEDNGYRMAGTYAGGKSVDGMGGGICQVSSTLYNAVLRAELTIVNRVNHMMTVGYVPISADATIANPDTDFVFRNDYEYPVFLEVYAYGGSLYANVYGVETRPANRTIDFVSVTEQTIEPGDDVITYDWSKPSWYTEVTQNAHTGYVAALYKHVYVDGVQTEEILVNRSTYGAYPKYITKGGQTDSTTDNTNNSGATSGAGGTDGTTYSTDVQ